MMYFKNVTGGCIFGVNSSSASGVGNISEKEYELIKTALLNAPIAPTGYGYRLRENLTWELYELPPEPAASDDDEITNEEAYNIIMGVET